MTTLLCYASTALGLATVATALADEALPAADRRVLVLSNNAALPRGRVRGRRRRRDRRPGPGCSTTCTPTTRPSRRSTPPTGSRASLDLPIWERSLRALWRLDGDVHLVVESIQGAPALALSQTFADAAIDVYAEGLMSYGPTRTVLPDQVGVRVRRVLHPDLVPGVTPLLLREYGVEPVRLSTASFQKVMAAVAADAGPVALPTSDGRTAVLLGQYLSALRLLSADEERQLYLQMVEETVAAGYPRPGVQGPSGGVGRPDRPLARRAQQLGARLTVRAGPELVETWYAAGAVDLVVGCFSTALATAGLYGVPSARVGTELMLERLAPYPNSNRIPATVVTATVPAAVRPGTTGPTAPVPVDQLVRTVGYLMQPGRNPDLRDGAVALLQQHPDELRPYVKRLRLTQLGLPGGQPPGPAARLGPAGSMVKRVLGRRVGRLARRLLGRRRV